MFHPLWTPPPPSPVIDAQRVHLWRVPLGRQSDEFASWLAYDERARQQRYLLTESRRRFTITRAMLRRILGAYMNVAPATLRLIEEAGGKPHLEGGELQFNVSHSGDLALIAVATGRRVGVDLERERAINPGPIARRWFTAGEREVLERAPERFLEMWTIKEAQLKAVGRGVWDIGSADLSGDWSVVPIAPAEGFVGAIAIEGKNDWRLEAFEVTPGRFPAETRD